MKPLLRVLVAGALAVACAGCVKVPRTCAPNDALCQSQMGAMNDPSCKNGTGSNGKCLDPRAP